MGQICSTICSTFLYDINHAHSQLYIIVLYSFTNKYATQTIHTETPYVREIEQIKVTIIAQYFSFMSRIQYQTHE